LGVQNFRPEFPELPELKKQEKWVSLFLLISVLISDLLRKHLAHSVREFGYDRIIRFTLKTNLWRANPP